MRIIFLNTWSGHKQKELFTFIQEHSKDTDIYCLSEVTVDLLNELTKIIPDFSIFFGADKNIDGVKAGQVVFFKDNIISSNSEKINPHTIEDDDVGFLQYLKVLLNNNKTINLVNVHGRSSPGTKLDTDIRINQSKVIIDLLKSKSGPKVIGGDFNLGSDTKSIQMFEEAGYINLIKEYKIENTRNKLSWEQFKNEPGFVKQYFADYCFVSPDIKVSNFEVPYMEVSDHLPQILDCEI
jgi:hypothetical protein